MADSARINFKDCSINFNGNFYLKTSNCSVNSSNSTSRTPDVIMRDASTSTSDVPPDARQSSEAPNQANATTRNVGEGTDPNFADTTETNGESSATTAMEDDRDDEIELPAFFGQRVLDLIIQMATGIGQPTYTPESPARSTNARIRYRGSHPQGGRRRAKRG